MNPFYCLRTQQFQLHFRMIVFRFFLCTVWVKSWGHFWGVFHFLYCILVNNHIWFELSANVVYNCLKNSRPIWADHCTWKMNLKKLKSVKYLKFKKTASFTGHKTYIWLKSLDCIIIPVTINLGIPVTNSASPLKKDRLKSFQKKLSFHVALFSGRNSFATAV